MKDGVKSIFITSNSVVGILVWVIYKYITYI